MARSKKDDADLLVEDPDVETDTDDDNAPAHASPDAQRSKEELEHPSKQGEPDQWANMYPLASDPGVIIVEELNENGVKVPRYATEEEAAEYRKENPWEIGEAKMGGGALEDGPRREPTSQPDYEPDERAAYGTNRPAEDTLEVADLPEDYNPGK
jgi:hypothetical protein